MERVYSVFRGCACDVTSEEVLQVQAQLGKGVYHTNDCIADVL